MPIYLHREEIIDSIPKGTGRWNVVTNEASIAKRHRNYKSNIKLKFECKCKRKWTTMKGRCEVKLWRSPQRNNISIIVYQQKCQRCQRWAEPFPYDKELDSIIKQKIDKWMNPSLEKGQRVRMVGTSKRNHDSARCEACKLGKCSARKKTAKRNKKVVKAISQ
jgi:hypothetical protein